MGDVKLLPCPFCGSEAIAEREGSPSYWVAMCAGSDCAIEPISGPCSSREAAIAAWNNRALTPAQQAAEEMLAALRAYEVLDDFHANCEECGDSALPPELCEMCFPYADDARLKMRAALAKAGKP